MSDSSSENFSDESPAGMKYPEKIGFDNSIIAPIRCDENDKKDSK